MELIIISSVCFISGAIFGVFMMALMTMNKVKGFIAKIDELEGSDGKLKLLQARIRAFQEHGKQHGKEVVYNLQGARGRFVKAYLPKV